MLLWHVSRCCLLRCTDPFWFLWRVLCFHFHLAQRLSLLFQPKSIRIYMKYVSKNHFTCLHNYDLSILATWCKNIVTLTMCYLWTNLLYVWFCFATFEKVWHILNLYTKVFNTLVFFFIYVSYELSGTSGTLYIVSTYFVTFVSNIMPWKNLSWNLFIFSPVVFVFGKLGLSSSQILYVSGFSWGLEWYSRRKRSWPLKYLNWNLGASHLPDVCWKGW
jgi:hypothetical protein